MHENYGQLSETSSAFNFNGSQLRLHIALRGVCKRWHHNVKTAPLSIISPCIIITTLPLNLGLAYTGAQIVWIWKFISSLRSQLRLDIALDFDSETTWTPLCISSWCSHQWGCKNTCDLMDLNEQTCLLEFVLRLKQSQYKFLQPEYLVTRREYRISDLWSFFN